MSYAPNLSVLEGARVDLREYLRVMRRGWAALLILTTIGAGVGCALIVGTTRLYEASVQLFVATSNTSDPTQLAQGNAFTQDRVQSYTSIATSPAVIQPVIDALDLPLTASQLADKVSADAPQNKVLINLHVTDHNARQASDLANAVATQFATVVEATEQTDAEGKSVVRLTVIHPAIVPTSPIKPDKPLDIGLGVLVGLVVGVALVLVRDFLDTSVKGAADFELLDLPVLGAVPLDKRAQRAPVVFRNDPHGPRAEAYRQLRTNLQFIEVDHPPRLIAVTSAVHGEGKTTTSVNLAAALAEAGNRVCLVEGDLRRPSFAGVLGLVGDVGLTTVLIGRADIDTVLQSAGDNLSVLTSGTVPPNPSELLNSDHARSVIAELSRRFDYVVLDSAPLLPVTDGAELATMAEATLVVIRAGKTTRAQAAAAVDTLAKVGRRPVGAVINMLAASRGGYGYGYGYAPYRPRTSAPKATDNGAGTGQPSGEAAGRLQPARAQSVQAGAPRHAGG